LHDAEGRGLFWLERKATRGLQDEIRFIIEPCIRFRGQPGEQATMFLLDPGGNAIEFKSFQNIAVQLFQK